MFLSSSAEFDYTLAKLARNNLLFILDIYLFIYLPLVILERMRTSSEFSLALTWRRVESPGIGRCLADNYSRDPPRQRWMSLLAFAGIPLPGLAASGPKLNFFVLTSSSSQPHPTERWLSIPFPLDWSWHPDGLSINCLLS